MATQDLFHCPNCNAGLDLDENGSAVVRCAYCQSVVIVPESLRTGLKSAPKTAKTASQKPTQHPKPGLSVEEAIAKVTELARSGQEIEAMKLYREIFPAGLQETKKAIDQAARGLPLPLPEPKSIDEDPLPVEAAKEITGLAALGQLDEAARLYRITFGTSHMEAKTAVHQLAEGKSIDVARRTAKRESQATAVHRPREEASRPQAYRFMGVSIFLVIFLVVFVLIALVLIFAF